MNYESLHNHTKISDGTQDHLDVLKTAEQFGYGVIAFTDHDAVPDSGIIDRLKSYKGPVKWFIGCELTSGLPKELGGGPSGLFHILGLFIDPTNTALVDHCHKAVSARIERMEQMVKNLQNLGFQITVEDCLKESNGESVGRPHIVNALYGHLENAVVLESLRLKMEEASKTDKEIENKYKEMMERGPEKYPYYLFMTGESFIKNVYVDYLYFLDMDSTVKLIRDAGGVAIMSHWGTVKYKINKEMLEQFLTDKRIDGLELASLYVPEEKTERNEQTDILRNSAGKHNCLMTIGIDAHRPEDYELFALTDEAKESVGITEKLIQRVRPSLRWSNLLA